MTTAKRVSLLRRALLGGAAALFLLSGSAHFLATETFARIVPPYIPAPRLMVYLSGVAELAGAVGLLLPSSRRAAGSGLALLLVAVFPANIYMAAHHIQVGKQPIPDWLLWGRLALQPLLIAWILWSSRTAARPSERRV